MQHSKKFRLAAALGSTLLLSLVASTFSLLARAESNTGGAGAAAARPEDALLGEWWTEGNEGRIKFTKFADGTFRGVTTCCRAAKDTPKTPFKDIHNPNPALRDRSTMGIVLIWKLHYEDGEYVGGYVYNPRDGDTYRMKIAMVDHDTVKIRGYLAIPLLGQSQIWRRAQPVASAPAP